MPLPDVLNELGIGGPLLVSTERWRSLEVPAHRRFHGALRHGEVRGVQGALGLADGIDGVVAVGGGSSIDTAKAVSAARSVPLVSVPTTYSGAERTGFFGVRDATARVKVGNSGAHTVAVIYEPALTLGLSREESGGTALNALAHCAEALYVSGRDTETDAAALTGAALIVQWLPAVLMDGSDLDARRGLLEGAMHAGVAMQAGVGVARGMAQALGGRYGLPHGTMNAVCLPPALRFSAGVAGAAIARFGVAIDAADPATRVTELSVLFTSGRLRDHGVARRDLPELAAATTVRPAALANPRPATAAALEALFAAAW